MAVTDHSVQLTAFKLRHPETRFVDVLLADLCGIPRGKRVTIAELPSMYRGSFLLPGSMFALDVLGGTIQETGLGFDEGDADRRCLPIEGTLVPVPWRDGEGVAQIQVSMIDHDGSPFYGDPRHVLASVLNRFHSLGLTPVVAIELEFYLLDPERTVDGRAQPPRLPQTGRREYQTQINSMADLNEYSAVLAEISSACEAQQIPAGTALAEYGPGQFEVNLQHTSDALLACDQAIRFKRLVRGVAARHGMEATFMPKPYMDMAGSGAHIHVSMLDRHGRNIFAADEATGSEQLKHAIGGLAATMADAMFIFAPTANSYRRYRSEAYVPLNANWAVNNRGVALRIPASSPENRRIEHRVAGADVNPYLLTAAVLAGIHHGLDLRLDPGPPVTGNPYRNAVTTLPITWPEAASKLEASNVMREYLGEKFHKLFVTTRRGELQAFESHVSPLEYAWYARTC
ncbi:glutamine synthetase [Steroidobacter sp. S1-65]|uniref:Glutamine synthetase n=1 Tax=Steroidobacter gossypii TaxID=2805490 RepID=A0ABS1X3R1_9GAMM|nr:glutamine synthetase family protein [Steroidobacter gossypii]MBM0107865.1 glutamine synthetase [Steroidobacter gossypii]